MNIEQIKAIINKDYPLVSNLSNVSAVLNALPKINWCGFYLVKEDALYLGPFQGELACSKIPFDKGICGRCFREKKTIIVNNVLLDQDHIACSSTSRSEIVTPIIKDDKVVALIDIDSAHFDRFKKEDKELLEAIAKELAVLF